MRISDWSSDVCSSDLTAGSTDYRKFVSQTGIDLQPHMGIDTSFAEKLWRGTSIRTEIPLCDFTAVRDQRPTTEIPIAPKTSMSPQLSFELPARFTLRFFWSIAETGRPNYLTLHYIP